MSESDSVAARGRGPRGFGSIPKRDAAGTYHVWIDLGNDSSSGKRRRKHVTAKNLVELNDRCAEVRRGASRMESPVVPIGPIRTVGDWMGHWLQHRPRAAGSINRYYWRRLILPKIGRVSLRSLTAEQVQHMLDEIDAFNQREGALKLVSEALDDAVSAGLLSRNVAAGIRVAQNRRRLLDDDEDDYEEGEVRTIRIS